MFDFGGLFQDSSNKSSSSSATTTNNTDYRMVQDAGGVGLNTASSTNSTINLNMLDGGTVKAALSAMGISSDNALAAMGITANAALAGNNTATSNALATTGIIANSALSQMGDTAYSGLLGMKLVTDTAMKTATDAISANTSVLSNASGLVKQQGKQNSDDFKTLLGATLELSKSSYEAMGANLSLAKDLNQASQGAYESASQQAAGNKNLVMAGMVVVGLAVVMMWGNK